MSSPGSVPCAWHAGHGSPSLGPRVRLSRLRCPVMACWRWFSRHDLLEVALQAWFSRYHLLEVSPQAWCLCGGSPAGFRGWAPWPARCQQRASLTQQSTVLPRNYKTHYLFGKSLCKDQEMGWSSFPSRRPETTCRPLPASFFNASTRDALKPRECSSLKWQLRSEAINLTP